MPSEFAAEPSDWSAGVEASLNRGRVVVKRLSCPEAALIISEYGDFSAGGNPNKPHMSPTAVETILQQSSNNQPCPTPNTVVQGPGFVFPTATCQGNTGYNSFFGKGIVDALKAVTLRNNTTS